jgi:hypothetical protein
MRALDIITDAYERCNRLSPGETLSADDAAFGLRRLNLLVDELSAQPLFLFKDTLISAAQTGNITLGAGAWAAIAAGTEIIGAACDNLPMLPITIQQYNEQYRPFVTGTPAVYAQDGFSAVHMWPTPNGQTITLQTRSTVSEFADQTTDYTLPDGWANALGAALAVRIAPNILGQMPSSLLAAEAKAMGAVDKYEPAIVDVASYSGARAVYPARLF